VLYTRGTWTCPAAGLKTTDKNWDRAFLSVDEFRQKYGETPDGQKVTTA